DRDGDTRRIGEAEVALGRHRLGGADLELAGLGASMECQRFFIGERRPVGNSGGHNDVSLHIFLSLLARIGPSFNGGSRQIYGRRVGDKLSRPSLPPADLLGFLSWPRFSLLTMQGKLRLPRPRPRAPRR